MSACENFNLKFYVVDNVAASSILFKVGVELSGFDHVFEHSLDFVHSIVSTFDGQLV